MAMIIFIIVAILVAAGLVTMNIRSSSRSGAHVEQEPALHEETPSSMPPVPAEEAHETAVQPMPDVRAEEETLKMDDNAYRNALQSMKTHIESPKAEIEEEPSVQPKKDSKMNDNMFRETLKSMRNQDTNK
ncbi:hypothetical protein SAMN05443252_10718 [Bacillus sp. OV322]|uniref:hypothetical protein n=1 Tax=Bacillus sp. OV322 TaxID=1882764 RepID=UPI0008F00A51|nr:hypothetical protein [Bacillus sp. OV322]SFC84926.1 hypothetical protein SAMN05443252_10718 [Bacillus sp. OV322]